MARPPRNEQQLREASQHLYYEYSMLMSLAQALGSGIASQGWLLNALLESFVVHFRSLLDFAYPGPRTMPEDVIAADFFDDPSAWDSLRPALSDALRRGRDRAGKEIVHLSYGRIGITPEAKAWHFVAVANEIQAVMNAFLGTVSRSKLGPSWSPTSN